MDWIEPLISGIAITAFLAYSNKKAATKVEKNEAEMFHLRVNGSYKWIGIIAIGFGLIVFIGVSMEPEGLNAVAFIGTMLFIVLGLVVLMWYYNHQLIFNETTIIVKDWIGKTKKMDWEEIEKIKFSPVMGYLRIYSKSEKLNIYQHLVGLIEFLKIMENKTDYKAAELKLPFVIEQNEGE